MNKEELKNELISASHDVVAFIKYEECPYWHKAKEELASRGFTCKVFTQDGGDFNAPSEIVEGATTTPLIYLRGEFSGGGDDVIDFFSHNDFRADDFSASDMMSNAKFFEAYSRWSESFGRYESWDEAVERVMNMHRSFYADVMTDELEELIAEAEVAYKNKYVLGAQRALQFGGEQLIKHQMRMYNCTSSYANRPEFFGEFFYILLCGAGCGFSVQKQHVAMLPEIQQRKGNVKQHIVEDSIEGWATALDVMLSSFFVERGVHGEYAGRKVYFDLSNIRPKGAEISGGFKAPGPEPLRVALDKVEHLLQGLVLQGETQLRPIHVYDICMFAADAVLAGGVRRSATICLFSPEDSEMLNAKTGDWYITNPQRGRSNNSAVIVRDEISREDFAKIMEPIKQFGEPGFYFVSDKDHLTNPCVEIGMLPQVINKDGTKTYGWQGCNLTEINGSKCVSEDEFQKACRAAAILGTLQAGYTQFKFLTEDSRKIFEREALLGCSITGWMNSPEILFNGEIQRRGAETIKSLNVSIAKIIKINPAARTTCVKPSGNASVLLKTSSGIHAEHSKRYLRYVQMNKDSEVAQLIKDTNPYMTEESVWSESRTDYAFAFPIVTKNGSLFKREMLGVDFLEKVRLVQQNWVEAGTNEQYCVDPTVRHNVSTQLRFHTVSGTLLKIICMKTGIILQECRSLVNLVIKHSTKLPNTEVLTEDQIVEKYGKAALFASGLIVDTNKGFSNLWQATFTAQQPVQAGGEQSDLQADWIRRFNKFADNYFDGDKKKTEDCLKDVYLLHKWVKIQQNYRNINFVDQLASKKFTDIDTMGAIACQGGQCEITF